MLVNEYSDFCYYCRNVDWHVQIGRNAVATPALIEVTSDQGLAVAESKQAWIEEDNLHTELPYTVLRSINPNTHYPTYFSRSVAAIRLVPVIITFPLDRCTSITINIVLCTQSSSKCASCQHFHLSRAFRSTTNHGHISVSSWLSL